MIGMSRLEMIKELFSDISNQSEHHLCDPYLAEDDGDPMCRECQELFDRLWELVGDND